MALSILIVFLSASLIVIIIPFARIISNRLGIVTQSVNEFRMQNNIPWLGGLPFLFTLVTSVAVGIKLSEDLTLGNSGILFMILLGGFLIFFVGLLHDLGLLAPRITLFGHLIVAIILIFSEIVFGYENRFIAYGLSLFYLIGAINAFRLRNGIDGLSTGLAGIAALFLGAVFYLQGDLFGLLIASIVVGSTITFLYYNFNPAKILLGANGSYILGLLLGIMAIMVGREQLRVKTFVVPLIILAIPILDTVSVLIQSLVKRRSIFVGTKGHIYHVFINRDFTPNQTIAFFYGLGIVLGVVAVSVFKVLS